MVIKKIFLFFVFLILMTSCGKDKQNRKDVEENEIKDTIDKEFNDFKKSNYFDYNKVMELKYKIVEKGDKFAYADLVLFYSYNKSKQFEILPYSLIMVEKHKKYYYCSTVFDNILEFYTLQEFENYYNGKEESLVRYLKNIELMKKGQKEYALYFLNLGAKNDDLNSVSYLQIIYRHGFGLERNLKKADSLKSVLSNLEKERQLKMLRLQNNH